MASHQDGPPGPWRTKGVPHYLVACGARLGLPQASAEHPRVKDNRQLGRIAGLLGQIQREYYNAPRHGDDRRLSDQQMRAVLDILATCEGEVGKVHAIAAAGAEMIGEAYDAFGLPAPDRHFSLVVAPEALVQSVEVASLRAEVDRLTAENAALAERLTAPAPDPAPSNPPNPNHRRPEKSANQR